MVKIGPPGPKVNTLAFEPSLAYASTSGETWDIINFLLELRPVDIAGLEPQDRSCPICAEGYGHLHHAVRLPCNHCFGERCIEKWLCPFIPWSPTAGYRLTIPANHPGANTCPTCRQVFFPRQRAIDCLPEIDARIKLWDWAYELAGVALSEREQSTREGMLRYIESYTARGFDGYYPPDAAMPGFKRWPHHRFVMNVVSLNFKPILTPVQRQLSSRLHFIAGRLDPDKMSWRRDAQGALFFQYEGVWETDLEGGEICEEGESNKSREESKGDLEVEAEEESIQDDTDEMRFFRAMFR